MITKIDNVKCRGCGICVDRCPMDTLRLNTEVNEIPPCQSTCPAGVDIRGYVYMVKMGMFDDAIDLITKSLPFPSITGRVCSHPCESACARKGVDKAVNIKSLERFVADYLPKKDAKPIPRLHIGRIAIVGSGSAGLSAANFLLKMGYPVKVFESMPELGGMLRYGIPEYQLPKAVLDTEINYLADIGVEFQTGVTIGNDMTITELKDNGYKAIFIAVGADRGDIVKGAAFPDVSLLKNKCNLGITSKGTIRVNKGSLTTPIPGVFAGGEAVSGLSSVVDAIASGKKAAVSIDRYLRGEDKVSLKRRPFRKVKNLPGEGIEQKSRIETPSLSIEQRPNNITNGFGGYTEDMAMEEVSRCMTCGSKAYIAHPEDCMTCFQCEIRCPYGAVDVHPFKEILFGPIDILLGGKHG